MSRETRGRAVIMYSAGGLLIWAACLVRQRYRRKDDANIPALNVLPAPKSIPSLPKSARSNSSRQGHLTEEQKKLAKEQRRQKKREKQQRKRASKLARAKTVLQRLRHRLLLRGPLQDMPQKKLVTTVLAFDVEAWEQDSTKVLEIGLAACTVTRPADDGEASSPVVMQCRHLLIQEHLQYRNGRYVADNKDNFLFGTSEVLPMATAVSEVTAALKAADLIVGHAVSGDFQWLRSIGVGGLEKHSKSDGEAMVDTQCVEHAVEAECGKEKGQRSLKALSKKYRLDPKALHNGANDAAFTLQVMLSQCGVPFDRPPRRAIVIASPARSPRRASVSNAVEERLNLIVRKWWAGEDKELALPASLSSAERRLVHRFGQKLGATSNSSGSGNKRRVTLSRPSASGQDNASPPALS